jgi:formylglycine-generating enzyme required for sulfatase activity
MIRKDRNNPQRHLRVLRGGSYLIFARFVRSAIRLNYRPGNRDSSFGLRVAMEIKRIEK